MQLGRSLLQFIAHSVTFFVFVTSIVAGFLLLYVVQNFFVTKEIRVMVNGKASAVKGLEGLAGENLLFIPEEEIRDHILRSNPQVKGVSVRKSEPGIVEVAVEPRTAVAQLKSVDGYFLLCEDGFVIEKQREPFQSSPIMTYYQSIPFASTQAGDQLDYSDISTAIQLVTQLKQSGLMVKDIAIDGSHVIRLTTEKSKEIVVTSEKDLKQTIYELETIIRETARRDIEFKRIDLRFEKPVYVPESSQN